MNALARLHRCAGLPEPSLVTYIRQNLKPHVFACMYNVLNLLKGSKIFSINYHYFILMATFQALANYLSGG